MSPKSKGQSPKSGSVEAATLASCKARGSRSPYGVPALAGQAWFRTRSRVLSSAGEVAAPCRLKPGLHTLRLRGAEHEVRSPAFRRRGVRKHDEHEIFTTLEYGVPALAGQTWISTRSRNLSRAGE